MAIGVVYLLVGIVGFAVTRSDLGRGRSGDGDAGHLRREYAPQPVAPGGRRDLAVASQVRAWARTANLLLGITYALLAVLGFAGVLGFLNIGGLLDPDNILHLGTAAMAIYFGSSGAEHVSQRFVGSTAAPQRAPLTPPRTSA